MLRIRRIIPILFMFIFIPAGTFSGDLTSGRLVRQPDAGLRERLVTAHLLRDEPVDALAISPSTDNASATDHYNTGTALALTGRYIKASEVFLKSIKMSDPGSDTNTRATLQFLKMLPHNPTLELPLPEGGKLSSSDPDLALALAGYFARKGDRTQALAVLRDTRFKDTEKKIVSDILTASHLASTDGWETSAKLIGKTRSSDSSVLVDILYLTRGFHYLQAQQPGRARSSFQKVPFSSPYAPEALHGRAWSLIRDDDLKGASIVLEELVDRHRYSRAAGEGILDLAIVYRELGLYDRAEAILDQHLKRLKEVKNWLGGLQEMDLRSDSDIIAVLEGILDGKRPNGDLLGRTPVFVRQWILETSADPLVRQTTALGKGIDLLREKSARLSERLEMDAVRVAKEIDRVEGDISRARATMARLDEIRNDLKFIKEEMSRILQSLSLNSFASTKAMALIRRANELKLRLALMENSVSKAEGFTNLVDTLAESVTASKEEDQLNRIRKKAYEGLISSRTTLRSYRNALSALEGKLWLDVKGGAISLERKTSLRVTSGRTRAGQVSADTAKALGILNHRAKALQRLEDLISDGTGAFSATLQEKLDTLEERIEQGRSARMLVLAQAAAREVRDAEALTLYTSADIEISRMERVVESLQEAVP